MAKKTTSKENNPVKISSKETSKIEPSKDAKKIVTKKEEKPKVDAAKTTKKVTSTKEPSKKVEKAKETNVVIKEKKVKPVKIEKSETLPDFIKHVLISQPEPVGEKSPYLELSKKYNLKIDFKPFLKVESIPLREFRKSKVNIAEYSSVIFNSKNAIDYFFKICEEMRHKMPQDTKYFCSSETIAFYLQKYIQYRKRKVTYANGTLDDFQNLLLKHKVNENFVLPCSSVGTGQLSLYLKNNKFDFKEVVMYRMVANETIKESELNHQMITFFNPEGVKSFFTLFPDFKQKKVAIGAFGDTTIKALKSFGMEVHAPAPIGEVKSMVMAIDKLFKEFPKLKK